MSTLKVGAIRGVSASSDAITVANDGTCTANATNKPNRNIVINGAMEVNQRASSYTATNSNEYTLDRFLHAVGSGFNFDTTTTQDSSSPDGFSKSLKITPDAVVTPSAGENGVIDHFIEGQDLQNLAFGTSSAKSITISFYAKTASANSGDQYTLMFQFVNGSGNRFIKNKAFTVTSSWQRYSVTFTGNTSESIVNDTTVGGRIVWILSSGPDDIAAEKSDWTDTDLYTAVTGQSNFMDNTSNEFFLTGVKLEIGSVVTDFEHESYQDTITRCMRYFQKVHNTQLLFSKNTSSRFRISSQFMVPMRGTPSYTRTSNQLSAQGVATNVSSSDTTEAQGGNTAVSDGISYSRQWDFGGFTNLQDRSHGGANGNHVFNLDAEL